MSLPSLHIIIPELFRPLVSWHNDFGFTPEASHLSALLAHYTQLQPTTKPGFDAALMASLGILEDELPIANYRIQTHPPYSSSTQAISENEAYQQLKKVKSGGGVSLNTLKTGFNTLLCADPVHLEVGINDISMTDRITDLTIEEAKDLVNVLNAHFKQDGIYFMVGDAKHWYILLPQEETVSTTPLGEVLRKNIVHCLPHSTERNWQTLLNEAQMLLHAHPINQQREQQGQPTINSLWFWGGGKPTPPQKTINHILSSSPDNAQLLAIAAASDWQTIDQSFDMESYLAGMSGHHILILDQLLQPAVMDNPDEFQSELTVLDSHFLAPVKDAFSQGKIDLILDGANGRRLIPQKPKWWHFGSNKTGSLMRTASRSAT